jgi:hypothetical protein
MILAQGNLPLGKFRQHLALHLTVATIVRSLDARQIFRVGFGVGTHELQARPHTTFLRQRLS